MVGGILADRCCSINMDYCHLSHFPQTRYRRRLTGVRVDGSTGVWKAIRTLEINVIACSPLPRVQLPVQNLTLKFRRLKFTQFLYSYLEASYEIYENLHRTKISRYTVPESTRESRNKSLKSIISSSFFLHLLLSQ